MNAEAGTRLFIDRGDLRRVQFGPDPDASRPLAESQVRLALQHFALTSNNITYAAFGQAMKYWQFFPAPDPAWGRAALEQRIASAWSAFFERVQRGDDPWVRVVHGIGTAATESAYRALLEGRADAREGLMLSLRA